MTQKVGKYEVEFRLQSPETIGEKDFAFDLSNYVDFLENKIEQNIFDSKIIEEKKRVALLQKVVKRLNNHVRDEYGIMLGINKSSKKVILETKLEA